MAEKAMMWIMGYCSSTSESAAGSSSTHCHVGMAEYEGWNRSRGRDPIKIIRNGDVVKNVVSAEEAKRRTREREGGKHMTAHDHT